MSTLSDGRYSLAEVLGEGGMATVYRAYDERLQVWRALKLLSQELSDDPSLRERFLTEARAMARLSHPHIVAVHDVRPEGSRPFIVMEWVGGGDLEAHVRAHGALPPRQAVEVLVAVLDALEAAHEAGVIHRDIKPQNVLISEKGQPKVADFGVARVAGAAKLTRTGSSMGTWAYMAPEQRAAGPIDHRVDIYAVGATLYLVLTGEVPVDLFASGLDASLLEGVPEALRGVVRKACAYRPEDRFGTAEEMQAALLALQAELPPLPEGCPPLGALARSAPVSLAGGTLVPRGETQIPEGPGGGTLIPGAAAHAIPEGPGGGTLIPEGPGGGTLIPERKPAPSLNLAARDPGWTPTEDLASRAAEPSPGGHTLEHHSFFQPEAEAEEDEDWNPGSGRWPTLALIVLLLLLAAGLAWRLGETPTETPPEPTAEQPPAPPEPAAVEAPASTPESSPPISEAPIAEAPTPSRPSKARSAQEAAPEPTPSGALVRAEGDAKLVLLEALDGTRHAPGALPAGRYTIYASFEAGALVAAGKLQLSEGQRVTLRCDSRFMLCRVE
ncbi:MAG: protein kinase [Alphaproteobacteria bacterium]|nr:protein kinase [Alphaproteobacteria bacterium]